MRKRRHSPPPDSPPEAALQGDSWQVVRIRAGDVADVIRLDHRVTGLAKPDYWRDMFERYGRRRLGERMFLVAKTVGPGTLPDVLGFIVGEVRAWEFGSAPCGWVLALSVEPQARLRGIGKALLGALAAEFKKAGVNKMRTMVARDNQLHLLFFRSEEMMAGPYIELEKELD
ncbi:MAG: GNAT family N-acetyltransferase [Hyphomicrobiaceae bacterium]|nr:MAG: GNAT family N-acetyltransferase [Hyphomicrobiaceae bacterium]